MAFKPMVNSLLCLPDAILYKTFDFMKVYLVEFFGISLNLFKAINIAYQYFSWICLSIFETRLVCD